MAVKGTLTQLVQKDENLLVTVQYLKCFLLMKEKNHLETKKLPLKYLAHLSCCVSFIIPLLFCLHMGGVFLIIVRQVKHTNSVAMHLVEFI